MATILLTILSLFFLASPGEAQGRSDRDRLYEDFLSQVTLEEIDLLLERGDNPNTRGENGETALMLVAKSNSDPLVLERLLEANVDPNTRDHSGKTALIYAAAYNNNPEMLQVFLDIGVTPNTSDALAQRR